MRKFLLFILTIFIVMRTVASENPLILTEEKIATLNQKISENNNRIVNIEKNLGYIYDAIERKKAFIAKRVMAINQMKKFSWQGVLNPKNSAEFDRNVILFKRLVHNDVLNIKELKLKQEEYTLLKKDLKKLNLEFEQDKEKLKQFETELIKLEKIALEKETQLNNRSTFLKYRGLLKWPVDKFKFKYKFGINLDAETRLSLSSKGILFHHIEEQDVLVFGPGKVIFSDRLPYWGDSVIVSHEGDYYSLYAGIKNVKVRISEDLKEDQIIGQTGTSDFYFELRHGEVPINPTRWIRNDK